jgi:ParB family chromosome partitioning protein
MTPQIKNYRVRELKRNPHNPGGGKRYEEPELRQLAKSLRQRQWMPLIVKEPELLVLDGNRRAAAAELDGMETLFGIPVTHELTPGEINRMIAQLDIRHQHFSEIARGKLWRAIRDENGWTNAQLADDLGVSPSLLTKVFGNLDNPEEIQGLVEEGLLSVRDGYHLSRIADVTERLRIAREIVAGKVKPDDLTGLLRRRKQENKPVTPSVRVGRIKCPLPSGATVQVIGEGISLDDAIEAAQDWIKEAKKASEQGLDAKTFQAVMRDKAKNGA